MGEKGKILISCVGNTDPYRGGYDGAICHIIRYEPEIKKVYLYFSKEMMKGQILNHRYTRAIKALSPNVEIEIYPKFDKLNEYLNLYNEGIDEETYKKLDEELEDEKKLIKDVHQFDVFYKEVYQILENIRKNEKTENLEILFNISSGTPAMKSSLFLISILMSKKSEKCLDTHIVQVGAPRENLVENVKHSTPETLEGYKTENVEKTMDKLKENQEKRDRHKCKKYDNTMQLILLDDVRELFEKCDYIGASSLIKNYPGILSPKLYSLAEHLGYRVTGRIEDAEKIAKELEMFSELYPIQNKNEKEIIEKFNIMKIKNIRDEINDWLLISTPLEEAIYMKLLDLNGIKRDDYTKLVNKKIRIFDFDKLAERHKKIYEKLKENINFDKIYKYINGNVLYKLIKATDIEKDPEVRKRIENFENSREARNNAAHTISYITREDIGNIKELEEDFKFLIKKSFDKTISTENFNKALNIYKTIEDAILEEFEKNIKTNDEEDKLIY